MLRKIRALSNEFEVVADQGIDERKRLSLAKVLSALGKVLTGLGVDAQSLHFRVSINSADQILLDPALSIPVHELWLYRNPVALAQVREGLADAKKGNVRSLASFVKKKSR